MGCICSKDNSRQELLRLLEVSELQEKLIVVSFEEKTQYEQQQILQLIYSNWKTLQHESSLINALKEIKFVKSGDPQSPDLLYKPNELFDPDDALLKSVFSGEVHKFPAQTFASSDKWLNILRKTGLRNTNDANVLLECAKRVELLGAAESNDSTTFEIWSLAETVVGAICNNSDIFRHKKFCKILGDISCIPAEKGYPFEIEKKGVKRVLCSYSEAVLLKDWALAWTVAPIISNQSFVPPEYSWKDLQLRTPPPFSVVLKHVQNGSRANSRIVTLEEATLKVLEYLDRIWDTLSSLDISKLGRNLDIAVANKTFIAKPRRVFSHPTIDIWPLAFELPSCYLPFMKILKELGVKEMLSISYAVYILRVLKKFRGGQSMCPNELRAVMRILQFICDEIEHQPNLDSSEWESKLDVPDDSCRLVDLHSCVYIDAPDSMYLKYIDPSKLRCVHHDVSERLCLAFGIKKLSEIDVEELDCAKNLQTVDLIPKRSYDKRVKGCGIGLLGEEVTPEDVEKVMFIPRRPFYKGEIVAWRSNKTDKFKYGRVPQDTTPPPAGHPSYRLDLETSPGNTETVVSSHVYKFSRRCAKYAMRKDGEEEDKSIQVEQPDSSYKLTLRNQPKKVMRFEDPKQRAYQWKKV